MTRILGLGDNTIDTYIDAGVQYPGGNAVNVAVMTAKLGASSAYLGCVGDDEGGQVLLDGLAAEGIDISRVRRRPGANARVFVTHLEGDRRFFGATNGVRLDYRWSEEDFDYISSFDHVHVSIDSAVEKELPRIAASGPSVSLDASTKWTRDYLRDVLPHVRYAFFSASGLDDRAAVATAEEFRAQGPDVVVMTRGSAGAIAVGAQGPVAQPALPAQVVDTLGAGDGFISGFLMAMLEGLPLHDAMRRGAAFAALACGWDGGFGQGRPWSGNAAEVRSRYGV